MQLHSLDLNLLVYLDALLEKRSVSAAAEHLSITQPAMSNALRRIRELFDDPMLVRSGRQMQLTHRAMQIEPQLKQALAKIREDVLQPLEFDPEQSILHLRMGCHDYEALILHKMLPSDFLQRYKNVTIEFRASSRAHPVDELITNSLDYSTGPHLQDRQGIMAKQLWSDDFVTVAHRHHMPQQQLSLDRFIAAEHLFIAPHGGMQGEVDRILAEKQLKRRVRFSMAYFSVVPWVMMQQPIMVTMPRRAAEIFAAQLPLRMHSCPLALSPFHIYLSWHESTGNSPGHGWFRDLINRRSQNESKS